MTPQTGDLVRFAHLPASVEPIPKRVLRVTWNGMLELEGFAGYFAPHLFVVVEKRKEEKP